MFVTSNYVHHSINMNKKVNRVDPISSINNLIPNINPHIENKKKKTNKNNLSFHDILMDQMMK